VTQLPEGAAIVVLGPSAIALARRLQTILPDASVHALAGKGMVADRLFTDPADHLAELFRAGTPIVGLLPWPRTDRAWCRCSVGIGVPTRWRGRSPPQPAGSPP
jgi:hypothetical protein